MEYKLSDQAIAQIVKLIQLGILTGTDVTDQLRTMSLTIEIDKNKLVPSPNFTNIFNENIERLAKNAVSTDQNDGE
jgi:hypothetical protein